MAVLTPERTGPLPAVRGERPARRALRHLPFAIMFVLAALLRVVAMIAYQGVLWFPDSHSYLAVAVAPTPFPARPQGYAFFLRMLEPVHSLAFVAGVQHAMGLAAGVLIYLTLRRFRTPGWVAALCVAPVLFDAYQLEMEHMLLSDALFWFLVLVAVVLVLWWPRWWPALAGAGLALGLAAVTRSVGLPLLGVFAAYLLVRRRWRSVLVTAGACALPIAAYALWFHGTWGTYAMTNSDGVFLYSRTAAFADCSVIRPPASERALCPREPVGRRGPSPNYIWHLGVLGPMTNHRKFSPAVNAWTGDFAKRAILAQPGAYLATGLGDVAKTFGGGRMPYPTRYAVSLYDFPARVKPQKPTSKPLPGVTLGRAIDTYTASDSTGLPKVEPGYAAFLRVYQHVFYLSGPPLALILAGGGVVLLVRRRRAASALLPWASAVVLLVVPPFTAAFDYRYVIPAVPLACLALGAALGGVRWRYSGLSSTRS
ncbi:MAG TPA: hypothetical protein VGL93_06700 [Streptosporangiaceae bacterium]|jgi:hypothetical protein